MAQQYVVREELTPADGFLPSDRLESGYYFVTPLDRSVSWCPHDGTVILYIAAEKRFVCLTDPQTLPVQALVNLDCRLRRIKSRLTIDPI